MQRNFANENNQELELISGTIEKFIFQNSDNGFSVFILNNFSKLQITVTGFLTGIQIGQDVQLKGKWIFHKKFGKQFEAQNCIITLPTSITGLKRYLGSGLIKGIGKIYAEKLVNKFGIEVLEIIEHKAERLSEIPGIGPKRIETIVNAWKDQKEIAGIMVFLQDKGISPAYAAKIYKRYKNEAISVLHENPYKLAQDIWGIGFKLADEIAQKIGFAKNSPQRIKAGIVYAITLATQQGNLYCELEDLKSKTSELLELNIQDSLILLKNAFIELYEQGSIKHITYNNLTYVTLAQYYYSEIGICEKINFLQTGGSNLKFDTEKIYNNLRTNSQDQIQLNENQQLAIMAALQNKITIITGGPGTGKTTIIKKLLSILDEQRVSYKLAAPTGRAAKRIIESTGRAAFTIHRLLEFDPSIMSFKHNEKNALKLDFLIIDEASMIDVFLAHALLKAMQQKTHLIFIGDIDQLPSVGAGNFLSDMIASQKVTCIRLTEIFRQAQNSLIIINAHKINKGEFPVLNFPDSKKDFIFIKQETAELVPDQIKKIFSHTIKAHGINFNDAIVLAPMNRGIIGTYNLNVVMQEFLNPENDPVKSVNVTGTKFKIGDRVMQIKNNYDKLVFNGDIGIIEKIDHEEKNLFVNFQDRIVEYDFEELNEIVLAYAISIHKSQGSEFNAVIVPVFMQHFMLLQRNLIYTAVTRAKKLCILIGQSRAIAIALRNIKGKERLTFLKQFLCSEI
ncbi:ATP-dependent RecD-like DNA helicase [Candidatus Dependentiae bacterium]|nr:ATP-dependent RecD-like DNA helicase [Candidatus Dependentiae bacterium]